ncbi:MAG TPA: DMT family transporter [Nocardioidaceae bacterium]|nr:DMT family transporter [Nocardioidaceae bacterium]
MVLDPALLAALVALLSASGFAFSTSLQHRVAGGAPESVHSAVGILQYVVRRPAWLLGSVIGAVALFLHAVALKLGAIALVQPLMLTGVVLAVLVRAGLDRRLPERAEVGAVVIISAALAVFLVVANPRPSQAAPDQGTAAVMVVAGVVVAGLITLAARGVPGPGARASLLGVAAGTLFGLTGGLLKLIGASVQSEALVASLLRWPLLAMVAIGVWAIAINQRAYQIAPLAKSMPVLNVVDVLVAVLFGFVVFGERPAHGLLALVVQGAALVCLTFGLRRLAQLEEPEPVAISV